MQRLREGRELRVARLLGGLDVDELLSDEGPVLVVAALVPCDREDAAVGWQGAVAVGLEQRGHQLAPGQIAGTAEEHEIEGHGGHRPM